MKTRLSSSRWSGAALILLAAVAGCHKQDSQALIENRPVEHAAAAGKEISAAGVTLTFPADWRTIDLTKGQFDQGIDVVSKGKDNDGAALADMARKAAQSGMYKMFVFDPADSKPGFVNNMNLIVSPGAHGLTIDQALDSTKTQLAAMNTPVAVSKTSFPAGEFGRFESHRKAPNGSEYAAIGYMFINGNDLDVVTFSCSADQAKEFDAKTREIMKSFKVG